MNINCTNKCVYQADGKCNLNALPSFTQTTYANDSDCPYCIVSEPARSNLY